MQERSLGIQALTLKEKRRLCSQAENSKEDAIIAGNSGIKLPIVVRKRTTMRKVHLMGISRRNSTENAISAENMGIVKYIAGKNMVNRTKEEKMKRKRQTKLRKKKIRLDQKMKKRL